MSKTRQRSRSLTTAVAKPPPVQKGKKIDHYLVVLVIVMLVLAFIRLRLASVPLERDEGEYAYMGRLILEGFVPYKSAYNMKLPGTYMMYAIIMGIFGKSITGIHYGLLLVNMGSILFLFLAFRKLFSSAVGFFTAGIYGIMSVSSGVLGFAAHATQFLVFFAAVALYFIARFYKQGKLSQAFLAGLFFGLSFLMKQQAVFFLLFGAIALILFALERKPTRYGLLARQLALYSGGVFLPYLVTLIILEYSGAFSQFWFWTVVYASKYASAASFKEGKELFNFSFKPLWQEFSLVWILFFAGIILTFFTAWSATKKMMAVIFVLCAFLTICPGLYFRQHYFISFLPGVGLLAALSLDYISLLLKKVLKTAYVYFVFYLLFFIVWIIALSGNREYYLKAEPDDISRMVYGTNPFPESIEIGRYIREHSEKIDKVAVLGSEPQILFYADRQSATGYLYTYSLMEPQPYNQRMQNEMISEIESSQPLYLVFCKVPASWLVRSESPKHIFEWLSQYTANNYVLEGITDIVSDYQTIYKWGADAAIYQPKSDNILLVFKRKS